MSPAVSPRPPPRSQRLPLLLSLFPTGCPSLPPQTADGSHSSSENGGGDGGQSSIGLVRDRPSTIGSSGCPCPRQHHINPQCLASVWRLRQDTHHLCNAAFGERNYAPPRWFWASRAATAAAARPTPADLGWPLLFPAPRLGLVGVAGLRNYARQRKRARLPRPAMTR